MKILTLNDSTQILIGPSPIEDRQILTDPWPSLREHRRGITFIRNHPCELSDFDNSLHKNAEKIQPVESLRGGDRK